MKAGDGSTHQESARAAVAGLQGGQSMASSSGVTAGSVNAAVQRDTP